MNIAVDEALLILKIGFVVLLYLFIWRIVRSASRDFRTWLHELFSSLCAQLDVEKPEELSEQLVFLYDGANISAQLDKHPTAGVLARTAAAAKI